MPKEDSHTKIQNINEGMVSTINWFSRNASAASFAALAEKMGIAIGGEPKKHSRKDTTASVLDAVASMDEPWQDDIGRMLEEMRTIGATKGSNLLIGDFLTEKKISIPEGFHEAKCADKVIWCHINLSSEMWAELKSRTLIETFTHWRGYNLVFKEDPEQGLIEKRKGELEKSISKWVYEREYRGKNCRSQYYRIGKKEYIVMLLTDHQDSGQFWSIERKKFEPLTDVKLMPSFHIIVTFNRETSRMNILFPSATNNAATCRALCELFCDTAFGKNSCKKETVKYNLAPFLDGAMPSEVPSLDIIKAEVVYLELALDRNGRHIRAYGEKDGNIHKQINDELRIHKAGAYADEMWVRRGQIRFTYKAPDGKVKTKTVEMSTSSSTIASATAEAQKKINAYLALEEVGILADEDGQKAGD